MHAHTVKIKQLCKERWRSGYHESSPRALLDWGLYCAHGGRAHGGLGMNLKTFQILMISFIIIGSTLLFWYIEFVMKPRDRKIGMARYNE